MLESVVTTAVDLFDAAAASVAVLDDSAQELVYEAAAGEGARAILGVRLPLGVGIAGWALASGQVEAVSDVADDPRFAREVAERTGYVPDSVLVAPLETERRPLGVLQVLDAHGGGPASADDLQLLSFLASQAAFALENAERFTELARVLLDALADASDGDLAATLRELAREAPEPRREIALIAAAVAELDSLGEREAEVAMTLVEDFLAYVRARDASR